MKQVSIQEIKPKHFKSFVNETVIELTNGSGLKLISGDNKAEPRLGANGSGKSTVWDAVCFCWYGTSVKGTRASDLISYGHKDLSVETLIQVDNQDYRIKRTAPPDRVYINGHRVEQVEVNRLLLSRDRFLNSVVFGQAVPLFIDLPIPARGDLLDEVLDLELWMRAAGKASDHWTGCTKQLTAVQLELARTKGHIDALPSLPKLLEQEQVWRADQQTRLADLINRFGAVRTEVLELTKQVPEMVLDTSIAMKHDYEDARGRVVGLQRAEGIDNAEVARIKKEIEFFDDNENCPVCGQLITLEFAEQHRSELLIKEMELEAKIEKTKGRIVAWNKNMNEAQNAWHAAINEYNEARRQIDVLNERISGKKREQRILDQQLIECRNETNPYTRQRKETIESKKLLLETLRGKKREEGVLVSKLAHYNYWRNGFRKVRLFCLERVLQELTVETRNSLLALGLIDWHIGFKTATETRSGTVKLGVQVEVTAPNSISTKFDSLSGGEGQRARLAVSLGLANLIQRWAGVKFNFEVWDEPTAWLSSEGVENLLEDLAYRAQSQDKSIWLLDHRALTHGSFSESYIVIKDLVGSRWQIASVV
jgi:DNA repair exonuclease SbcCD ATPase subunit